MSLEDLYRLLRTSHTQAQGIVDTMQMPLLLLDRTLCVVAANRAFCETFCVERDETAGRPLYELSEGQWDIPELRDLLERVIPKSIAVEGYEVTAEFKDLGHRTMLLNARRLFHPDNTSTTLLLTVDDVSQARREEAERNLLLGEMRHRVKNLLAIVGALARQTETAGRSAEAYRESFLGRLDALIHAHELSFQLNTKINLATLIERTLAPYTADPGRTVIEAGPAVPLAPSQVLPMSLILQELATNAVKYGAWSTPGGRVCLRWQAGGSEGKSLGLRWEERGGPSVTTPSSRGFGTRLIEFAGRELGGKAELTFAPAGLKAEIGISLI